MVLSAVAVGWAAASDPLRAVVMSFTPLPGQQVGGYDLAGRRGTDYYAVFADIPDADRAVWERAQGYVDEIGDRMQTAWDAAEYPLDLARRLGELDLLNDGIEHPSLTHF